MENLKTAQNLFTWYTGQVNRYRALGDFEKANEYFDMLLGAKCMYEALTGAECTVKGEDNISVTVYEEE